MEQKIFFHEKSIYVTIDFLVKRKVPRSTIYNNTSTICPPKRRWYSINHPNDKKAKLIAYDSIPNSIIEKYALPSKEDLINMQRSYALEVNEIQEDAKNSHIYNSLCWNYELWREYQDNYDPKLFDEDRIEKLCKTEALLTTCLDLLKYKRYKIKDLFSIYCQFDDVVFKTESHNYFCNKLKEIRTEGNIGKVIIHGLIGHPSNNKKLQEDVNIEIERHYCNPKKYNAQQILEKVNKFLIDLNRKPISISSVYRVLAQLHVKNTCAIARHGIKYTEDHLLPHAYFNPPNQIGTLWAMDGSRFQFAYKTLDGKIHFLTFLVIMDCASKKILGHSFAETENSKMTLAALEKVCRTTKYLPTEIILDNSKAFKSNEMVEFIAKIKLQRVYWHLIRSGNSKDNGIIERFFGVFQETFCKLYDGYIGEGIRSSNLNGRPSIEELKRLMKYKNLRTKDQLIQLLNELINKYNNYQMPKEEFSPNQKFCNLLIDKKVKKISTIFHSHLFWPTKELTVNRGAVLFSYENKEYVYNIYNVNILTRLQGVKVRVRYTPNDLSKILVFDYKTDEYITTLNVFNRIPKAISDRSEFDNKVMQKHSNKVKSMKKEWLEEIESIIRQSEKTRENLPPEITELGLVSKEEKEEAETAFLEEELQLDSKEDDFDKTNGKVSIDKLLNNVFQSKGSLKILSYGKN